MSKIASHSVIPFQYESNEIRVIRDEQGEPWWVAKDVCDVLGLSNHNVSVKALDDDERWVSKVYPPERPNGVNIITVNEPGLYTLIIRSNKPEAKAFKRWITHEVLPQIRKTGVYQQSLPAVPLKFCVKCDTEKPATEFWVDKGQPDGKQKWCKACFRKADPQVKGDLTVRSQQFFKDLMVQMKDEIVKDLTPAIIRRQQKQLEIPAPPAIDEAAIACRISNDVIATFWEAFKFFPKQADAGHQAQERLENFIRHRPPVPVPTENDIPVTDFGVFSERPWKTAQKLHPELYVKLEAKYAELGKDKHRGVEALRNSMFYETEEFGTLMDYMVHKAPRFLENILKLQLAALGHGVIMEEVGKLSDRRTTPMLRVAEKKKQEY